MEKLEKANKYVEENRLSKEELPVFHVAPPIGWMNDPNGFSFFQGKAHLFYQYHPYSREWGPMHWGHCVSEDMVVWKEMPVALAPDQPCDREGCFSGSAIEAEEGQFLFYTGVMEGGFQNQCLAWGDGISYKKYENNPIISSAMLPENASALDFRDPKVWKEEDGYYMVVGNKTQDGVPQVLLFRSENLEKWEYVSVLAKDQERALGTMWECPDFFQIDGEYMMINSPENLSATEEFHNGKNSVYFQGDYDRKIHQFLYREVGSLDDGLDFYAPQTTETPDGRRILIGWMQSWESNIRPDGQKWSGMMTLPRELTLVEGKLLQNPIRELENYRRNPVSYREIVVKNSCELEGIQGRVVDLLVEITGEDYREFAVIFAKNQRYQTRFTYDREKNQFEIDRTFCGMYRDMAASRKVRAKVSKDAKKLMLRIVLDKYSAEIFVNDGVQVFSTTFYSPLCAQQIAFDCHGVATINVEKFDLQ